MYVAVYGTLQKGRSNNIYLRQATFKTGAIIRGFELYDSGFPVANKNPETTIRGEVWDIGDLTEKTSRETLWHLDSLEGYRESNPDGSMYHRIEVNAYGDDGMVYEASMYLGNPFFWENFTGMRKCEYDTNTNSYIWRR